MEEKDPVDTEEAAATSEGERDREREREGEQEGEEEGVGGSDSGMAVMTAGLKTGVVTGKTLEAAGGRGSGPGSAGRVEEACLCARGLAASFPQTGSWWAQSQG